MGRLLEDITIQGIKFTKIENIFGHEGVDLKDGSPTFARVMPMRDEMFTFKIDNKEVKETIFDWAYSFAKDNILELSVEQIRHIIKDVITSINHQILQIQWKLQNG